MQTETARLILGASIIGQFLPARLGFRECADLDGSEARRFLESHGFTVALNYDAGTKGVAITTCGIALSTNGYCYRAKS